MNGFDRELKNRVLGMIPQATVSSTQILTNWPELAKKIEQHEHVQGVAPFTQLQGMLTAQGQVSGIMVNGIEPEYEKVSIIQNHMVAGSIDNLKKGEFGIVLGKQMTDALGLGLNDSITAKCPYGYSGFYVPSNSYLKYGQENEIRVIVRNGAMPNSRWYSGGGIYQDVWLLRGPIAYLAPEGVQAVTESLDEIAVVKVRRPFGTAAQVHTDCAL